MNWSRPARPPPPAEPLVVIGAFFGDDEDVEAAEGLGVAGEGAVGGGDEDAAEFLRVAGADLDDAVVKGAGGAVGAQDQFEAGGQVEIESAEGNGIEVGDGGFVNPWTVCLAGPEAMRAAVRAAWSRRSGLRLSV
jgi:hypothetical protein